jgi:N6-adenosine-specific RNA methylase IME4
MTTAKTADIIVGDRHRKDMGDLRPLARSIAAVGLLQPLVVTTGLRLIAGRRRLEAVRSLGWDEVEVLVADRLEDALQALRAERDENTLRKDFTPSEAVAIGEQLEALERAEAEARMKAGVNQYSKPSEKFTEGAKGQTRDRVGEALGMSGVTYQRAKAVVTAAEAEPAKFRDLKERMDRSGKVNSAFRDLQVRRQAERIAAEPPPLPRGPFHVLVVDPPWPYEKRGDDATHRGVVPYPSMPLEQIRALPVPDLAGPDAILLLWATNTFLPDACAAVRAWGFEHRTVLTWVKDRVGLGNWLRGQTEHCLLAVRGRPVVTLSGQTTVLHGAVREHSQKPEEFYRLVESLCPGSKVELFSRCPRPGWVAHGDQAGLFAPAEGVPA